MIVSVLIAMCIASTVSGPVTRIIDNSINGIEKITHRNMPQEIKETFPNLIEITKKLTKLYVSGTTMRLTADVFAEASLLEMIDLSDGDLSEIENGAFYGTNKLKKLNLAGNKLQSLPRSMFSLRNSLKELDLSNNQIKSLNRSTFKNMRNLRKLNLSNNKLTELNGFVFADLTELKELDLTGNPIRSINEEFFASLPQGLQLSFDDHHLDFKSLQLTEQWSS